MLNHFMLSLIISFPHCAPLSLHSLISDFTLLLLLYLYSINSQSKSHKRFFLRSWAFAKKMIEEYSEHTATHVVHLAVFIQPPRVKKITYFFSGLNFSKIITPRHFVQLKGNAYSTVRTVSVESAAEGGDVNENWQREKIFERRKNGKSWESTPLMADAADRNGNEAYKPATVAHIHKQFAFGARLNTMKSFTLCEVLRCEGCCWLKNNRTQVAAVLLKEMKRAPKNNNNNNKWEREREVEKEITRRRKKNIGVNTDDAPSERTIDSLIQFDLH